MSKSAFVKSADTKVPVGNSRGEIEKILRRYGAVGFNVQQTFQDNGLAATVTVQFVVPDSPGSRARVPVSLPINIERVYDALYGRPMTRRWNSATASYDTSHNPKGYDAKLWAQAERVAWRNIVLWIDAALSATSVGLQTITEAFYAHAVVHLAGGGHARLSEVIENAQGELPPGIRALLASPADAGVEP